MESLLKKMPILMLLNERRHYPEHSLSMYRPEQYLIEPFTLRELDTEINHLLHHPNPPVECADEPDRDVSHGQ